MLSVTDLLPAQCILLAASLASSSNVESFRSLVTLRPDCFDVEIVLRILLTFLPETTEPSAYIPLLQYLISDDDQRLDEQVEVDCGEVADLSVEELRAGLKNLRLHQLRSSKLHPEAPEDPLTLFLIRRSHIIDLETGLFHLVAKLVEPFQNDSSYLCDWYVGVILPHLRLNYEYYQEELEPMSLAEFENLAGRSGLSRLLEHSQQNTGKGVAFTSNIGRDMRGIVAPWIYGNQRWAVEEGGHKRRRLDDVKPGKNLPTSQNVGRLDELASWALPNEWIVSTANQDLPLAANVLQHWSGPSDVDLGENEETRARLVLEDVKSERVQRDYCRAAFAAIYAAESETAQTVENAYLVLTRLAELLNFETPPDLATSVHLLPKIGRVEGRLERPAMNFLQLEKLLAPDNPFTDPIFESFSLLQMLIFSANSLSVLGHRLSISKAARLRFWGDDEEQLNLLRHILNGLLHGARTEDQWGYIRDTIIWLWGWNAQNVAEANGEGCGMFGKIQRQELEKELLRFLCRAGQYKLVKSLYLDPNDFNPIHHEDIEKTILELAFHYYDEASNGNRTRGSMKKASDLLAAFSGYFPRSPPFIRFSALLTATHSMSSYSLTLQRGVPFKPQEIRQRTDPVSLLDTILEQNPRSYTHLDDLIKIGVNLEKACEPRPDSENKTERNVIITTERRVISMAIEAALAEDDFETAYSFVTTRLTPLSNADAKIQDDYSWRAAYLAGRQRPSPSAKGTSGTSTTTSPQVRRLEQRMELLAQSLLLAPDTALPEVLAAWRRCEEELLTVLAEETEKERTADDYADRGELSPETPGSFGRIENGFMVQPRRKELGRGAIEERPMGLFDVARGAAAAFQRSTAGQKPRPNREASGDYAADVEPSGRPRKRDMVANAVTGGLASGIGWVLGATPVKGEEG